MQSRYPTDGFAASMNGPVSPRDQHLVGNLPWPGESRMTMLNARALSAAAALPLFLASMNTAQAMSPVCRKATGHLMALIHSASSSPRKAAAIADDLIHPLLHNSLAVSLAKPLVKLPSYSAAAFIDQSKRMPRAFTPSQPLLDAFESLNGNLEITRIPGVMMFAGNSIGGTASCNSTIFFKVENGIALPVDGPADWQNDPGGSCGLTRVFASIEGTSFVVDDDSNVGPNLTSSLTLTPWVDGKWIEPCTVQVSFAAAFDMRKTINDWKSLDKWENNACEKDECEGLQRAALDLVRQTQSDPDRVERRLLAKMTAAQRAEYRRLKSAADRPEAMNANGEDNEARRSSIKPADLRDDHPLLLPMVVKGRVYLASVGHFTIGWRVYADWKVSVDAGDADKSKEIARFAIGMAKGWILAAAAK
jgi:hypothetical protein